MSDHGTIRGACFCGAVELEVTGEPAAMGYCHCDSCRHWSAGPINAFTLWKPENVKVVKGEDQIGMFSKTERSNRKWCTVCGGHLMTVHPGFELIDVYAALLPDLDFRPALHVFYAEKKVSVKDGLPKMKDMPAELGGSGETLPE
ncbi:MAG: GFA family protein [Acidobacteriota bacterium]